MKERSTAAMRVAIATDTFAPQMNGVARTLGRLADELRARGHDVRVYTASDPHAASDADVRRFPSIPFWAYPELRLAAPSATQLARELADWRPTLVHAATPFGVGLAARAAARALRTPLVTSYHTSLSAYAKFYHLGFLSAPGWRFLRWFHNGGARTYAPTRAIIAELEVHGFQNLALWSRGVDRSRFHPRWRRAELRARWGADDDTVVVAYVGRLAKEKDVGTALGAMRLVQLHSDRTVFVVAGDGPHEAECRRLAPGGTIFLGRVVGDELSAAYASSDIQLFPSTTDTFGNVLLEGMASGLAIVAADAAPTREILADGGGITVAPRAPDRLAAAVLELVRVPALRAQLRQSALQNAVGRSWDAVFDSLVADYARVAGHGPPHLPDDPLAAAALSVTTTMDVLVTRPPPERSEIMTK